MVRSQPGSLDYPNKLKHFCLQVLQRQNGASLGPYRARRKAVQQFCGPGGYYLGPERFTQRVTGPCGGRLAFMRLPQPHACAPDKLVNRLRHGGAVPAYFDGDVLVLARFMVFGSGHCPVSCKISWRQDSALSIFLQARANRSNWSGVSLRCCLSRSVSSKVCWPLTYCSPPFTYSSAKRSMCLTSRSTAAHLRKRPEDR